MTKKILPLCGLLAALLGGCHASEHQEHESLLELEVTQPLRRDSVLVKEYVSQIHAWQHIEVRALEKGYLQQTFVDEGKTVEQGQPLFKILPTIYEAEYDMARAEAEAARIEYENTRALADKNIVSQNELAVAKAELDKAAAEVNLAQTHLAFTAINAPFSGMMDHLEVRVGSLVDEGELLTTLSDLSKMWVYFNVPEAEYLDYKLGVGDLSAGKVRLKLANGMVYEHEGVIETIEADFDNTTGNIEFRATFPNPDQLLRHGQTGNILMDVPFRNALVIPQKGTFEILDKTYVYVLDEENHLQQRAVHIAAELPHVFIVDEGLDDTDTVLIEGLRRVQNEQEITPRVSPPEQVLANLDLYAE
ncbi:MAG: efflux RND transporter periplasmic adaptor subunit [Pseudohongiellaceae bacterium]